MHAIAIAKNINIMPSRSGGHVSFALEESRIPIPEMLVGIFHNYTGFGALKIVFTKRVRVYWVYCLVRLFDRTVGQLSTLLNMFHPSPIATELNKPLERRIFQNFFIEFIQFT